MTAYESNESFASLRNNPDVFAYRYRGRPPDEQVLIVPLSDGTSNLDLTSLPVAHHMEAITRLIDVRLAVVLPHLELKRVRWGWERVRRQDDLIDEAFGRLRRRRPEQLHRLRKHHRTVFRVRREHMAGRGAFIALTTEFRRHHEVQGTAHDLLSDGFQLLGVDLFSVEGDGKRVWKGTVVRQESAASLIVTDGLSELQVDPGSCYVEPSMDTFSTLFRQALPEGEYERLLEADRALRARDLSGDAYVERLRGVAQHLAQRGDVEIASGLSVGFGAPIPASRRGANPSALLLPQTEYCFSWDRTAVDRYPSSGLDKFGPFDGSTFDKKEPSLLVICPSDSRDEVDRFCRRLIEGLAKEGQKRFSRGLLGTYRLTRVPTRFVTVDIPGATVGAGHLYREALREHLGNSRPPDIVLVVIRDEDAFVARDNAYLAAKAFLLGQGIPSQEVRLSKLRSSISTLQFIMEDLALAMYAKLGGCPWTVRPTLPLTREVVLGMAHAQFGGRYSPIRRLMGITTVFSSDGTYLLAAGSPRCKYEEYPEVLAASVKQILVRLAKEQSWTAGEVVRLIFHAPKPLKGGEIEAIARNAVRALGEGIQFESAFLTIETDHPFKLAAPSVRGRERFVELMAGGIGRALVGECVPERGTVVDLGQFKRLLCVNGPSLIKREGESIPQPLQIELHRESTYRDMTALTRQVFHFTGLSWGSMLPITQPVTLHYPYLIAQLIGRLSEVPGWSEALLDTQLRRSRWFL